VHWSAEDAWGGARLMLWRDSLSMAVHRPWAGFGPETFSTYFPAFQSLELARAYPDFYHESPHNAFLDALTAQGIGGLLALLALTSFGFYAVSKLDRERAAPLAAGWAGLLVCHQFVVFVVPTAAYFYLWLAMLAGSAITLETAVPLPRPRRAWVAHWTAYLAAAAAGLLLSVYAIRLAVADEALASAHRAIAAGHAQEAAQAYQTVLAWQPKGPGPDLSYSRGMAELAAHIAQPNSRRLAWGQAIAAGRRAASFAEDRHNAYYNVAALLAAQDDSAGAEQALRSAIAAAPNWYKPHWTLARLLALTGRDAEALVEAQAAVERGGARHEEVLETLHQLERKHAEGR
jgi:tetratricopeptide (TPR) repeat protein